MPNVKDCPGFETFGADVQQAREAVKMSRRELDARKKLLGKRRDMTETIFAEVKEQLAAYTATPEYRQSLKDSLTAMAARMPCTWALL